jgi:hypothetical protein
MSMVLTVCLNALDRESVTALPETVNASLDTRVRHVLVLSAPMIALEMVSACLQSALQLMLVTHTPWLGIPISISDVNVTLVSVDLTAPYRSVPLTMILCSDVVVDSVTTEDLMTPVLLALTNTIVTVPTTNNVIALDVVSVTTNLVSASASPDSSVRLARSRLF